MNSYIRLVPLCMMLICSFVSCKSDDAPVNPCASEKEVEAGFVIEEVVGGRSFEGDTVGRFGNIRFRALQNADKYTWILGAETLRTQSFVRTGFPAGMLDVSLSLKRNPSKLCFPQDDGADSAYKKFFVWQQNNGSLIDQPPQFPYYPIYGTYRGYNQSNPSFEFTVTLFDTFWKDDNNNPRYVGIVSGIPYAGRAPHIITRNVGFGDICDEWSPKAISFDFRGFKFAPPVNNLYTIPPFKGYAWLDRADPSHITIEYTYSDTLNPQVYNYLLKDVFVGQKIY